MRTATRPSAAELAASAPPERDRYLDLLRAFALSVVVLGHWLVAIVWVSDGQLQAENLLVVAPWSRGLTWLLQVMPLFFLVGGVVNARSWRSARQRGSGYASWLRARSARLLRPAVPLLWTWAAAGAAASAAGVDPSVIVLGTLAALVPLWFLAVYLMIVAATPAMLALHDRAGLGAFAALALTAAAVDAVHHSGAAPIGMSNFFFVWAAAHQLGFCWGDGLLNRRAVRWSLLVGGLSALLALVVLLGYPVSMVGVDGAARSNNFPPSAALVALGAAQAGAALMGRPAAERWLARPRVWTAVVRMNLVAMTMYLWHLTAMVALVGVGWMTGLLPSAAPLSAAWWAGRPLWLALLIAITIPLVALLSPVEWSTPKPPQWRPGPVTAAVAVGALAVAAGGVARLLTGDVDGAASLPIPLWHAVAVTAAAGALGAFRSPRGLLAGRDGGNG